MTTQVEALAKYAARAGFADLSQESRRQLPIHILDSLGCCIAALGAGPVQACREQVAEFGGSGPCALTGGGQAREVGLLRREADTLLLLSGRERGIVAGVQGLGVGLAVRQILLVGEVRRRDA